MTGRERSPIEWQYHCQQLLAAPYGVRVQIIPDRDGGHGGLEAYVADEATASQRYAPVDPFPLPAQTKVQRDNTWADTKKLIDKPEQTLRLIGAGNCIKEGEMLTHTWASSCSLGGGQRSSALCSTLERFRDRHDPLRLTREPSWTSDRHGFANRGIPSRIRSSPKGFDPFQLPYS